MNSTRVAIELLYDHIDVVVVRGGRTSASRRLTVALPTEAPAWAAAVRDTGEALGVAVRELGIAGAAATVLYRSPTQAVDLASFPVRSPVEAREAAILSCAEALPYSITDATCEAVAVGRDRTGPKRQTHVVVAAERNDMAAAMVDMVEMAGLKFCAATPIDAAIIGVLVNRALRHSGPLQGWLQFGEHSSFFVVVSHGAVRFGRPISLGVETLVTSLTRPARVPDRDEPVELKHDVAAEILHLHGIPEAGQIVHKQLQLSRHHIMPLIQPVLQRFVVELRQSLRFGLSEEERSSVEITVTGPGSAIPGFAELIGQELGLQVTADARYGEYDYREPAAAGSELVEAIGDRKFLTRIGLQTVELARQRYMGRLRRWLWAGAAAAVALIAADGVRIHARLNKAREEAVALTTATAGLEVLQETQNRLLAALRAMDELERTVAAEVGAPVNFGAILQEFSRLTPESVRLNSIQLQREAASMIGGVTGHAADMGEVGGKTQLELFMEALKGSPLFENVVLKSVQVGSLGHQPGQQFSAGYVAVPTPLALQEQQIVRMQRGIDQ